MHLEVDMKPHLPFIAAIQAAYETMTALNGGAAPNEIDFESSEDLQNTLINGDAYKNWTKEFLS